MPPLLKLLDFGWQFSLVMIWALETLSCQFNFKRLCLHRGNSFLYRFYCRNRFSSRLNEIKKIITPRLYISNIICPLDSAIYAKIHIPHN
jgi:hypothetical protein